MHRGGLFFFFFLFLFLSSQTERVGWQSDRGGVCEREKERVCVRVRASELSRTVSL